MEQGTVILSLNAELLWGQSDILNERRFIRRYPNAMAAHDHVLRSLCNAHVNATWLVVGGLALNGNTGAAGLPPGNEVAPLWYQRSFIRQLANASTPQDIGLHGGLTYRLWTDRHSTRELVKAELEADIAALKEAGVQPSTFSFPRNLEAHHSLLAEHGIAVIADVFPSSRRSWAGLCQVRCFG